VNTAGTTLRTACRLMTWWIGMVALILSQVFEDTVHGNLPEACSMEQ
jgi:hypothetical protein